MSGWVACMNMPTATDGSPTGMVIAAATSVPTIAVRVSEPA